MSTIRSNTLLPIEKITVRMANCAVAFNTFEIAIEKYPRVGLKTRHTTRSGVMMLTIARRITTSMNRRGKVIARKP